MKVRVRIKVGSLENGREGVKNVKSGMSCIIKFHAMDCLKNSGFLQ